MKSKLPLALSILALLLLASGYVAYVNLVPRTSSTIVYCPKCFEPLIGELSAKDVSCSLATGVCALTIVNNSTTPLQLVDCQVSVVIGINDTGVTYITTNQSSTGTATEIITTDNNFNGTVGGPAAAGVPANSQVAATCAVPTTELAHEPSGSSSEGVFRAKIVDSVGPYAAGAETSFNFEGTWS
jgi:hypothetical protein